MSTTQQTPVDAAPQQEAGEMCGLEIRDLDGAAVLKVRAVPGSSRERVVGVHGDALKVAVSAPPEKGKANARILSVLADAIGLPVRSLAVTAGASARDKLVRVEGIDAEALLQRLAEYL